MKRIIHTIILLAIIAAQAKAQDNATALMHCLNNSLDIVLTADITISKQEFVDYLDLDADKYTVYSANFNGNGHTVTIEGSISKTGDSYIGLVRKAKDATIANLTLKATDIKGDKYVGALVGEMSGTTIKNCNINISGELFSDNHEQSFCGGIVGKITGTGSNITDCNVTILKLNADGMYAGGIAGAIDCSSIECENHIERCHTHGRLYCDGYDKIAYAGGYVGMYKYYGSKGGQLYIEDCVNNMIVESDGCYTAGFIGEVIGYACVNHTYIRGCVNNAQVICEKYENVGGIVGDSDGYEGELVIDACTNNCQITGKCNVGGIVGTVASSWIQSKVVDKKINFWTGEVDYTYEYYGNHKAYIKNCYSHGTVKAISEKAGGIAGGFYTGAMVYLRRSLIDCLIYCNNQKVESWGSGTGGGFTEVYDTYNCYGNGSGRYYTPNQMESGELAYLLNGKATDDDVRWRQNIDSNREYAPVICYTDEKKSAHAIVFKSNTCDKGDTYSNTFTGNGHNFENGYCTRCGYDERGTYQIESISDFIAYAEAFRDKELKQDAELLTDIDLTASEEWGDKGPIGVATNCFTSTFNGNGHTITLASTKADSEGAPAALFGIIKNATIKDLNVNGYITSSEKYSGMIQRCLGVSNIIRCTSALNIISTATDANAYRAGFVALASDTLNVSDCSFIGSIDLNNNNDAACAGFNALSFRPNNFTDCLCAGTFTNIAEGTEEICKPFAPLDSLTNCYYVGSRLGDNITDTLATNITEAQLASGEATYRLNNSNTATGTIWRQTIDAEDMTPDATPVLCVTDEQKEEHPVVFSCLTCVSTEQIYSNYLNKAELLHDLQDGVRCSRCTYVNAEKYTYTRENAAEWGTICLPVQINTNDYDNIVFYHPIVFGGNNGTQIYNLPYDIPAGQPLIYHITDGSTTLTINGYGKGNNTRGNLYAETPVESYFSLGGVTEGTFTDITIQNNDSTTFYYLTNGALKQAVKKTKVGANRAYFYVKNSDGDSSSKPETLNLTLFGETTAIKETTTDAADTSAASKAIEKGRLVIIKDGKRYNIIGQRAE